MGSFRKRMENLVKAYSIDDKNSIAELRFQPQYKKKCNSNGFWEHRLFLIVTITTENDSSSSKHFYWRSIKETKYPWRSQRRTWSRFQRTQKFKFYVNFYAPNPNLEMETSFIAWLKKITSDIWYSFPISSGQMLCVVKSLVLKSVQRKYLWMTSQKNVQKQEWVRRGAKREAHFSNTAKYADSLLKQTRKGADFCGTSCENSY